MLTKRSEVFLDHDVTFSVPTREVAAEYVKLDEAHTTIAPDEESGEWNVTRHAGSMIRVPRRATMTRTVGGQFPKGFDPTRWGIPASMVGDVDKIALWNIVTTVDAYLGAGFTPAEILESIHPSLVASTQGTGFGGMMSMRKLYLDRFLNHEIPTDILQEALPNVVAAHVMQSYIGGYGNMIQPVSACATAAVSLEEGVDKIALGKADFVVTGAIDDIGVESVIGFGNMNATANSEEMYGKGIDARFFSRANDRRRGGFLESQGGGTILVTAVTSPKSSACRLRPWSASSTPTRMVLTPRSRLRASVPWLPASVARTPSSCTTWLSSASQPTTSPWSPSTTRPPTPTTRTNPSCTTRWPTPSAAPTATRCS